MGCSPWGRKESGTTEQVTLKSLSNEYTMLSYIILLIQAVKQTLCLYILAYNILFSFSMTA